MIEIIESLEVDPWLVKSSNRPERAYSVAINSAMAMIES